MTGRCRTHTRRYKAGCEACRAASRNACREKNARRGVGLVSARDARGHLRRLTLRDHSLSAIARQAGISLAAVRGVANKTNQLDLVHRRTAAAILAVTHIPDAPRGRVNAVPTTRRLQALTTRGFTNAALAAELGYPPRQVKHWLDGDPRYVLAEVAAHVARRYPELLAAPAPTGKGATYARNTAAKHSWWPPTAWPDDSIDELDAAPYDPATDLIDDAKVVLAMRGEYRWGNLNHNERLEVHRRLSARGVSQNEISRLVRCSGSTLCALTKAAGRAA